jgi:hypothetical protein
MEEIWKSIPDYEDTYKISSFGRVKSLSRVVKQEDRGTWCKRILKQKLLKPEVTWNNRIRVTLVKDKQKKRFSVHRLVGLVFVPNPMNKPHINHKDGNPQNNHYTNIEWCTPSKNEQHAINNGLRAVGADHVNSNLSWDDVKKIRKKYIPHKYSTCTLAKEFGVRQSTIWRIVNNKTYKKRGQ